MFRRWLRDQRGTTAIEYAVIGALIFAVLVTGLTALGDSNNGIWARVGRTFATAMP